MISVEQITSNPQEQELIGVLDPLFAPFYRDLPYLNYARVRDEVLVEALRLEELDEATPRRDRKRVELIAASLGHAAQAHIEFTPTTRALNREERSALVTMETLTGPAREAGLTISPGAVNQVGRMIAHNRQHRQCRNRNDVRLRRATIASVGSEGPAGLVTDVVRMFHDAVILSQEAGTAAPAWPTFLDQQHARLSNMIKPGLAIGEEHQQPGKGPFYERATVNLSSLTTSLVQDPARLLETFGEELVARVPTFDQVEPYITRAAV